MRGLGGTSKLIATIIANVLQCRIIAPTDDLLKIMCLQGGRLGQSLLTWLCAV